MPNDTEYTPTTGEVLTAVVIYRATGGQTDPPPRIDEVATPEEAAQYLAEFYHWLAEVRAEAWDSGYAESSDYLWRCEDATAAGQGVMIPTPVNPYRAEASRLREGAGGT